MAQRADKADHSDSRRPGSMGLVITCEHGGNRIPAPYGYYFRHCRSLLNSHRGFDAGALVLAKALAAHFDSPLLSATTSRLLVDLNRSIGHQDLHIERIQGLDASIREDIIAQYYRPYRTEAEQLITRGIARYGSILHLACHSFTPQLDGVTRDADIGLLYDPARPGEKRFCADWQAELKATAANLQVRRNYPYQGRNDGLTTSLRKKFAADAYLGIELELNQKNLAASPDYWANLQDTLINTLASVLSGDKPALYQITQCQPSTGINP